MLLSKPSIPRPRLTDAPMDRPNASPQPTALRRRLSTWVATLLVASLAAGCSVTPSSNESQSKPPSYQLVWPGPPNDPRFVFDGELRNHSDIHKETEQERLQRILTGRETNSQQPVYRKPSAIAAANGRLYVADPPSNSVIVFDMRRGRIYQMGVREPNRVTSPISLAIDAERRVYVLDGKSKQVMVYDSLGLFLFAVGVPSELTKPAGVAVSPDGSRIFIVDRGSVENEDHKVIAYAPDGRELYRLGPRGTEPGQFNIPLDATVSRDGKLHILDSGNFRIQTFDESGKFLSSFGSVGNGLGQFSRPRALATDSDGNIYVSDASFNNVQIFSPKGNLLMWLGEPGTRNLPGQFGLIGGIAVDETGRLYVADQFHLKVEVFRRAEATASAQAPSSAGKQQK